jgi:hypothetical protein
MRTAVFAFTKETLNFALGGPGRNRTTDTRIFKTRLRSTRQQATWAISWITSPRRSQNALRKSLAYGICPFPPIGPRRGGRWRSQFCGSPYGCTSDRATPRSCDSSLSSDDCSNEMAICRIVSAVFGQESGESCCASLGMPWEVVKRLLYESRYRD